MVLRRGLQCPNSVLTIDICRWVDRWPVKYIQEFRVEKNTLFKWTAENKGTKIEKSNPWQVSHCLHKGNELNDSNNCQSWRRQDHQKHQNSEGPREVNTFELNVLPVQWNRHCSKIFWPDINFITKNAEIWLFPNGTEVRQGFLKRFISIQQCLFGTVTGHHQYVLF